MHTEIVTANSDGRISLVMKSILSEGGVPDAHMDLNGMEIRKLDITEEVVAKLDFGQPGVNVQPGFYKLGLPDGGATTYTGTFPIQGKTCKITVDGYTHTRGNYGAVVGKFAHLSNLLRSSFLRNTIGSIMVGISGLEPWNKYEIKTYHHSAGFPRGGVDFPLQYDGNLLNTLKESADGNNPNPPLMHTEIVTANSDGRISLVMKSILSEGGVPDAHMDLNGMEIRKLDITEEVVAKLDFGQPGVNVQPGFYKLGLPDGGATTYTGTFPIQGKTCKITVDGYTHTRGNYGAVVGKF